MEFRLREIFQAVGKMSDINIYRFFSFLQGVLKEDFSGMNLPKRRSRKWKEEKD